MRRYLWILVCCCAVPVATPAQVITQVTDVKTTSFDLSALDDAGGEVFVITSTNQFGGNPDHLFQVASFDAATGSGAPLTGFVDGLAHTEYGLSVSDDGQWLAFISGADLLDGPNHDRSPEMFVAMRDGTQLAQLTDDPGPVPGSVLVIAMSGSANRIAFVANTDPLGTNPDHHQQLFGIDRDGTNLVQLTSTTGGEIEYIAISDDGQRIAFSHDGDLTGENPEGNFEIFAINADGTGLTQITSSAAGDSEDVVISGDGAKIAFQSTADLTGGNADGLNEIFLVNWDGTSLTQLTDTKGDTAQDRDSFEPSITDDASVVFYASGQDQANFFAEIFKINADGSGRTQLTTLGAPAEHPIVAGGGGRVAFSAFDTLYVMDDSGGNLLSLTERDLPEPGYTDITPDGGWLAWDSDDDPFGTNPDGSNEVFMQRADGTDFRQVTDDPFGHSARPSITPDGSLIVFESSADPTGNNLDGNAEIFKINADGTGIQQLTTCTDFFPFGVGVFSVHPVIANDGSVIVFTSLCDLTGGNFDGSGEIFKINPDGTGLAQLTSGPGPSSQKYSYWPRLDETGTWVTFSGNDNIDGGNADGSFEVWRMKTDGTGLQRLTDDGGSGQHSFYPDISGDGSRIVFLSRVDLTGGNPDNNTEIFLWESGTGTTTQLTDTTEGDHTVPRISRDGQYLYFRTTAEYFEDDPDEARLQLHRMHIDSRTIERAGGLGTETGSHLYWPAVDGDGDRVLMNSRGDLTEDNPDLYYEIFFVDHSRPASIQVGGPAPTRISWDDEPGAIRYDVIRGDVANLKFAAGEVDLGPVVCLEDDSADAHTRGFDDAEDPVPGQAFFYLYRGSQGLGAGPGSWGTASEGSERVAGAGGCAP